MADPKTSGPDPMQLLRKADEAIEAAATAVETASLHLPADVLARLRSRLDGAVPDFSHPSGEQGEESESLSDEDRQRLREIADGISIYSIAGTEQRALLLRLAASPATNTSKEEPKAGGGHELKCWPPYFEHILLGQKTFEVRSIADRSFAVGDKLLLREFDGSLLYREPVTEGYTGRTCERLVTYVLGDGDFGIQEGHVVLGLRASSKEVEGDGE
jgi:hypothetical protein